MDENVIDFTTRCKFEGVVDHLDNMQRAINSAREMLSIFGPSDRLAILGQVLASTCCEYGGRNACGTLARNQLGECFSEVSRAIDKTFPPLSEEGMS